MFCSKCGFEVKDNTVVCTNCGCPISKNAHKATDIPNIGLNILGFFVPLAGLIMFCTMIGKTPKKAKQIGLFALIGFIINIILICVLSAYGY